MKHIILSCYFTTLAATFCVAENVDVQANHVAGDMQWWVDRTMTSLEQLVEAEGYTYNTRLMMNIVAFELAGLGHDERTIPLLKKSARSEAELELGYVALAGIESARGDVAQAQKTAASIQNDQRRQSALSLIAIRRAQVGDYEQAFVLLDNVECRKSRNRALRSIVQACISDNRLDLARAAFERMDVDDDRWPDARRMMEQAEAGVWLPLASVRSPYLRSNLPYMLLFGSDTEALRHVARAWHASIQGNDAEYKQHVAAAVDGVGEQMMDIDRAIVFNLLAVIAYERGDHDDARRFVQRAAGGWDDELLGISSVIADSALAYLFVALTPWDELTRQVEAMAPEDRPVEAIAAVLAEQERFDELEQWYQSLEHPEDRIHAFIAVRLALDKQNR